MQIITTINKPNAEIPAVEGRVRIDSVLAEEASFSTPRGRKWLMEILYAPIRSSARILPRSFPTSFLSAEALASRSFLLLNSISADLTGKLACINKTSSSVCSACLTFLGFPIPSFEPLINSGQSNFCFFHRNFRSKSKGSDGGNKSKLGLSVSPKGTTTPQSTTELFYPHQADTVFPPTGPSITQVPDPSNHP